VDRLLIKSPTTKGADELTFPPRRAPAPLWASCAEGSQGGMRRGVINSLEDEPLCEC
jgi:hypothetical protein